MTDAEIIKALEYCPEHNCDVECPLFDTPYCVNVLMKTSLDLIQRQKERIERLKDNLDAVLKERTDHTEAIKDFADRVVGQLKESSKTYCEEYGQRENTLYLWDAIDIVKEMVGETDDR